MPCIQRSFYDLSGSIDFANLKRHCIERESFYSLQNITLGLLISISCLYSRSSFTAAPHQSLTCCCAGVLGAQPSSHGEVGDGVTAEVVRG